MGSKISIQDIDRQAEIHARNELISRRGKEIKELKEEISEMNTYGNKILKENKELKQRNLFLENEYKELVKPEPKELDDK